MSSLPFGIENSSLEFFGFPGKSATSRKPWFQFRITDPGANVEMYQTVLGNMAKLAAIGSLEAELQTKIPTEKNGAKKLIPNAQYIRLQSGLLYLASLRFESLLASGGLYNHHGSFLPNSHPQTFAPEMQMYLQELALPPNYNNYPENEVLRRQLAALQSSLELQASLNLNKRSFLFVAPALHENFPAITFGSGIYIAENSRVVQDVAGRFGIASRAIPENHYSGIDFATLPVVEALHLKREALLASNGDWAPLNIIRPEAAFRATLQTLVAKQ
jgi:hypothetical protein